VAIPAFKRKEKLLKTLHKILECDPLPCEVLVHVDGRDSEIMREVGKLDGGVKILSSATFVGPGGGRNKMMIEADCDWVAHFDDDSYPLDKDYFARVMSLVATHVEVDVWCAAVISHGEYFSAGQLLQRAVYHGCGHVMRKAAFMKTHGYLPLPVAYNLEEVDVSLQIHEIGGLCVQAADLRVWHDNPTPSRETFDREVAMMRNTILFPLLRFPVLAWPQAFVSVLRRGVKLATLPQGWSVLWQTLRILPDAIAKHIHCRDPVSLKTVFSWLLLRRAAVLLNPVG
jgi:GT2 family glycosyltransferase